MSTKKPAAPGAPADVTFADSLYASRSLFLASGEGLREFKVVGHRVTIQDDDAEALEYLINHAELQILEG
ncbi:hypothetical protein [Pseudomonas sp. Irchel 3H3]|uniref:hypothetical protein n=1 Tax=Pseudomonas sp. Irchel 3H3 TaxID=2009038 RepID=UPI000BA39E8E|nr:hypothetical protein [Pseudomonas sp. Irchel 3H3]